jgi:hypothetical protein
VQDASRLCVVRNLGGPIRLLTPILPPARLYTWLGNCSVPDVAS